jgi:hypothetical protein
MAEVPDQRYLGFEFWNNGCFYDNVGEQIAMFGVVEMERFFSSLDEMFESPLGRKVIFAATDAEEWVVRGHSRFRIGAWFGRKKTKAELQRRALAMGWGFFQGDSILSPCHDGLCVGLALAHREHLSGVRWNVQWQQLSSERIELVYEPNERTTNESPQEKSGLWTQGLPFSVGSATFDLDLDLRSFGFFRNEERCFFLPVSLFSCLYSSLIGRPMSTNADATLDCQIEELNHATTFRAVLYSSRATFLHHDFPVFVQTVSDWEALLSQRISQRGLGEVSVRTCVIEGEDATLFVVRSTLPAYVCGLLVGMWERAVGSRSSIGVVGTSSGVELRVKYPVLDY